MASDNPDEVMSDFERGVQWAIDVLREGRFNSWAMTQRHQPGWEPLELPPIHRDILATFLEAARLAEGRGAGKEAE